MGTSNFHHEGCFFAVTEGDEFTWDDTRSNVSYTLAEDRYWMEDDSKKIDSELRSFPATSIGVLSDIVQVSGFDIEINIVAMTRSGYYKGFNLDYEVSITCDCGDYEDGAEAWDDMYEYNPSMRGLLTIHKSLVIKSIDDKVKVFTERLEEVYAMYSDNYKEVGRFSAGTSLIEKAS